MAEIQRDHALDCTKGIAILVVVLFHITRGFTAAGQLPESVGLRFADAFAYSFHVQSFLLIAGYLAFRRANQPRFQIERQLFLYYAYLLWSVVSWLMACSLSGQVNNAVSMHDLLLIPIVPIQHFWFILVLMTGTAMLAVLRTPAMLLAIAVLLLAPINDVLQSISGLTLIGTPFAYTGSISLILVGGWLRATNLKPAANIPAGLICLATLTASVWVLMQQKTGASGVTSFPITLAACYVAYVAGSLASRSPRLDAILSYLGQNSLSIYILHVMASAGVRILLHKMAPQLDAIVAILCSLIAAIALPLAVQFVAERLGLAAILGLRPFRLSRPVATAG